MDLINQLKDGDLTLEEKLAAIDAAMADVVLANKLSGVDAPIDPADLTICDGCS